MVLQMTQSQGEIIGDILPTNKDVMKFIDDWKKDYMKAMTIADDKKNEVQALIFKLRIIYLDLFTQMMSKKLEDKKNAI